MGLKKKIEKQLRQTILMLIASTMFLACFYPAQNTQATTIGGAALTYSGKQVVAAVLAGLGFAFISTADIQSVVGTLEMSFNPTLIERINNAATQLNPFAENVFITEIAQDMVNQIAQYAISEWGGMVRGNQIVDGYFRDYILGFQPEINVPVIYRPSLGEALYARNVRDTEPLLQSVLLGTIDGFRRLLSSSTGIMGHHYTLELGFHSPSSTHRVHGFRDGVEFTTPWGAGHIGITGGTGGNAMNVELLGFYICPVGYYTSRFPYHYLGRPTLNALLAFEIYTSQLKTTRSGIAISSARILSDLTVDLGAVVNPNVIGQVRPINALTNLPAAIQAMINQGLITGNRDFIIAVPATTAQLVDADVTDVVIPYTAVGNPPAPPIDLPGIGGILGTIVGILQAILDAILDFLRRILDAILALPNGIIYLLQRILDFLSSIAGAIALAIVGTMELDFQPLEELRVGIVSTFPFSIPWDLRNAFLAMFGGSVAATPAPVFEIDLTDTVLNSTITIDFAEYETMAVVVRWGIMGLFVVGLVMATGRLIQW